MGRGQSVNTATHEPTPVARDPCHVLDRSVDSPTFRPDRAALLPLPSGTFLSLLVRLLADTFVGALRRINACAMPSLTRVHRYRRQGAVVFPPLVASIEALRNGTPIP